MECSNGKVRVVVRSTRVPVGLTQFTMPLTQFTVSGSSPAGFPMNTQVRSMVFANVLDPAQQRLLEEARHLAEASCLDLEVVDLQKQNVLRRAVSRLLYGDEMLPHEGIHLQVKSLSDIKTAFNSSIN